MAELPAPESALTDMIYRAWEERAESWDGLGFSPSLLGTECDRALWYQLHWAPAKERFDGRMLRLFRTGQIEEDRIIEDLIMCGLDVDPVDPATGKQFNVRALAGHVRGKTDGRINSGVPEAPKKTHIVESKHDGKDNCAWFLFGRPQASAALFFGRANDNAHPYQGAVL